MALWAAAGLCCLVSLCFVAQRSWAGAVSAASFPAHPARASEPETDTRQTKPEGPSVLGRLEIPALGIAVPITPGIDPLDLTRGVGHVAGTALPGGLGTVGLAGHRDTYLRALRHVARGMDVRLIDQDGTYHYTVDRTEIVSPEQVSVLAVGDRPKLVLITCYPFNYVGAAPQRFIVHATLVSANPDR